MTESKTAPRRGRPRPQGTITRDDNVHAALVKAGEPVSREHLATELKMQPSYVYLSLYRLRQQGRAVRENRLWKAA